MHLRSRAFRMIRAGIRLLVARVNRSLTRLHEIVTLGPLTHIAVEDARPRNLAQNDVERYWSSHVVNDERFETARASTEYLAWRFEQYPLFREFMDLWGEHDGHVILDYGCGPGDDTTGFLLNTNALQVVSCDVGPQALELTRSRLARHRIDPARSRLLLVSDRDPRIPLGSGGVDHVNCGGVLHHTSYPDVLLQEFHRILKTGGTANVMVYGYNSVYIHLFIAYHLQACEGRSPGMELRKAFEAYADGEGCPIAACYLPDEFAQLCTDAGFETAFMGGYLSQSELRWLKNDLEAALADSRLPEDSRRFLGGLQYDDLGLPTYEGRHAGLSYVYRLMKH
ncbi:MAG: class I SAM-dependent methyltransferase [Actinobacteria bacterium]|nr:class I SAM-dependent methyltransferase [Actinomycetota bacterium]